MWVNGKWALFGVGELWEHLLSMGLGVFYRIFRIPAFLFLFLFFFFLLKNFSKEAISYVML